MTAAVQTAEMPELPAWNLADLYPARDAPELARDLDNAERAAQSFHQCYAGRVATLGGDGLAAAIAAYEALDETLSRIFSFGQLVHAGDLADPAIGQFYQSLQERANAISVQLVFFSLEINKIEDATLAAWQESSPALQRYRPWLRDTRAFRPHQLTDELERFIHEKYVVGRAAWNRLFDETMAQLRFPIGGAALTAGDALNRLTDRDRAVRREAGEVIGTVLGQNIRLFALITNTLAKDKEIEDKWRRFDDPAASRHLSNRVEPEVVEALVGAVKNAYPRLSGRYYRLKARWMGDGERLDYWDRNAPLPEAVDRPIPWSEARALVLDAYGRFSPKMADLGRQFFDNGWIDAQIRPAKSPGAFAHPTVPSVHPYILMNYHGKARDVMTLAHELGHGVHQRLAGQAQGHLLADTPLTLAETASVFGEMLTFQALLDAETDPGRRRILIATKVEDMLNTVVRQIAFYDFETRVHRERRQGELTAERISEHWLAVQTESLGPALRFDEGYRFYWSYIPHFIHSPFYVYAYAFGDCLVNSLYAVYQDAERGFAERYLAMLSAGGTLRHQELLAPFGLNAGDPAFWERGLGMISRYIDQLEAA